MVVKYKQLCGRCKKKYVPITRSQYYVVCDDCLGKEMKTEIKDKKMKKFFDIPEEFFKKAEFLRSIKLNYLRYGDLSEKQKKAFKETVAKMKKNLKK